MKGEFQYNFKAIEACNMCLSDASTHTVMGKRLNKSQGFSPKNKIGITTTICKCDNCGLIYSNPQPIPADISDHYGVPPEQYWVKEYFDVNPDYFKGEIKILTRLLGSTNGIKTLDIGAGIGKQMVALANVGCETYGLEPSKPFYDKAVTAMGIDPERLKLGMVEELDYPENYFDFISFGVVLEHLYSPADAINKAMKWLKPGGIMHIEVPSSSWLINKLINIVYKVRLMDYVANISPMHEPYHLYEFSHKSFAAHAKKNNYEIAYHEYYPCDSLMPEPLNGIMQQIMLKTDTGMQLCVWLKKP